MNQFFSTVFFVMISLSAYASVEIDTIVPGRMLSFKDTLEVQIGANNQRFLLHPLKAGQTLYGLSKYYAISITDLRYYNPELANMGSVHAGYRVRIPISLKIIKRQADETTAIRWKVVPVIYIVRPGETLFSVARRYFAIDVEVLKERNGMIDNVLKPGQKLLVGWFYVTGIPTEMRRYTGLTGAMGQINSRLKQRYRKASMSGTKVTEKGIAIWSKGDNRGASLYILHRTAKPGTIVQLSNPMNKVTLYAKVLGPLPADRYGDEVLVYAPPVVATALGALDPRFAVNLTYYQ